MRWLGGADVTKINSKSENRNWTEAPHVSFTRVTGMFVTAVASSLNFLCQLSFLVSLARFCPLVGGRAFALNERLGFAEQRMGDDPIHPRVTKIRFTGFGHFAIGHFQAFSQSCAGMFRVVQSVVGHRQHRVSSHLPLWGIPG